MQVKRKISEKFDVQLPMVAELIRQGIRSEMEVVTSNGRIDILTADEIIECKAKLDRKAFYEALGQLQVYGETHPTCRKAIAVYDDPHISIERLAAKQNIKIYVIKRFPRPNDDLSAKMQEVRNRPKIPKKTPKGSSRIGSSMLEALNTVEQMGDAFNLVSIKDDVLTLKQQEDYAAKSYTGAVTFDVAEFTWANRPIKLPGLPRSIESDLNTAYVSINFENTSASQTVKSWAVHQGCSPNAFVSTWEEKDYSVPCKPGVEYLDRKDNPNFKKNMASNSAILRACALLTLSARDPKNTASFIEEC